MAEHCHPLAATPSQQTPGYTPHHGSTGAGQFSWSQAGEMQLGGVSIETEGGAKLGNKVKGHSIKLHALRHTEDQSEPEVTVYICATWGQETNKILNLIFKDESCTYHVEKLSIL